MEYRLKSSTATVLQATECFGIGLLHVYSPELHASSVKTLLVLVKLEQTVSSMTDEVSHHYLAAVDINIFHDGKTLQTEST